MASKARKAEDDGDDAVKVEFLCDRLNGRAFLMQLGLQYDALGRRVWDKEEFERRAKERMEGGGWLT